MDAIKVGDAVVVPGCTCGCSGDLGLTFGIVTSVDTRPAPRNHPEAFPIKDLTVRLVMERGEWVEQDEDNPVLINTPLRYNKHDQPFAFVVPLEALERLRQSVAA